MTKILFAVPAFALLSACGGNSGDGAAKQQLKIVGSSTVYPFTTAVAEQFQRDPAAPYVFVVRRRRRLAREHVNDLESVGICSPQARQVASKNHILPGLVRIHERMPEVRMAPQ